jgi:hypothetical protein
MKPMSITLLYEPSREPPGPLQTGPERYDRLAAELARHAASPVERITGYLGDIHPEGFVLLHSGVHPDLALAECPREIRASLASRLVPLGVSQKGIFEILNSLSLPAAVTGVSLWEWEAADPDEIGAWGLYGLRAIGARVGATSEELFETKSARYGYLKSEAHRGLPHLLADYLRAYAETVR